VTLRSARGWLAGDTDMLAGWQWAWSKRACTGAAHQLALHGRRGQRAAMAWKIAAVLTAGVLVVCNKHTEADQEGNKNLFWLPSINCNTPKKHNACQKS